VKVVVGRGVGVPVAPVGCSPGGGRREKRGGRSGTLKEARQAVRERVRWADSQLTPFSMYGAVPAPVTLSVWSQVCPTTALAFLNPSGCANL
jgi:hypothetical protein